MAVQSLTDEHRAEALAFLAERPLHNVVMAGFIRDHGLVSALNRGTFYACRDAGGRLAGVALIGHAIFFDARTEGAYRAFARLAQTTPNAHMLMGERQAVEQFWGYCAGEGLAPRLLCRELLFEQQWPVVVHQAVPGLRPATLEDLELVIPVHAHMAFEESGVNPLEADRDGFRSRCARRVERGRTWVWVDDGELLFKADVVAETPEVIYLEGIYVAPHKRCQSYGLRCVSQLSRHLLQRTESVTLLTNEQNQAAQALYRRAGFKLRASYDTIFL